RATNLSITPGCRVHWHRVVGADGTAALGSPQLDSADITGAARVVHARLTQMPTSPRNIWSHRRQSHPQLEGDREIARQAPDEPVSAERAVGRRRRTCNGRCLPGAAGITASSVPRPGIVPYFFVLSGKPANHAKTCSPSRTGRAVKLFRLRSVTK